MARRSRANRNSKGGRHAIDNRTQSQHRGGQEQHAQDGDGHVPNPVLDTGIAGWQVFRERVTLRGDDPIFDDHVSTLFDEWTRAQAAPLNRTITRDVARSSLDEDPDTIIFGWVLGNRDEIYARVGLTPFSPSSAQADSNVVTGQFGPAGA